MVGRVGILRGEEDDGLQVERPLRRGVRIGDGGRGAGVRVRPVVHPPRRVARQPGGNAVDFAHASAPHAKLVGQFDMSRSQDETQDGEDYAVEKADNREHVGPPDGAVAKIKTIRGRAAGQLHFGRVKTRGKHDETNARADG